MKTRKLLVFAACAVLLIAALCVSAFAAEIVDSGECGENLTWTLDSDGVLTISGTGEMTEHPWWNEHSDDIKQAVIGDGVTTIGNYAFYGCTSLTSVTIGNGVTEIGDSAFEGCTSLTGIRVDANNPNYSSDDKGVLFNKDKSTLIQAPGAITDYSIPDSVTTIGDGAFYRCTSLTSVTIGNGVSAIGKHAFSGCSSLTSATIPDSVTSIGEYAFCDCASLTSVTIPDSVTSIGGSAFRGCTSLTGIHVDPNNPNYSSDDKGVLFNKDKSTLIAAPGAITDYTIPDSVMSIGYGAFRGCTSLASVTIGDGVTEIGSYAFNGCTSLTSVTIPDSVTTIGDVAFYGCTSLTSVTIPDSVTTIGEGAFSDCTSLTSVTIGDGVTTIDYYAFANCTSLTSVTIGDGVTTIDYHAFADCTSLTSVTIPDSVTWIDVSAFQGCTSLTGIHVDPNNPNYSSDGKGVLFNKDKSTLARAPGAISDYSIPDSVTSIDLYSFDGCTSLTDVYYSGTEEQWKVIKIESFNAPLINAAIHFNSTRPHPLGDIDGDSKITNTDLVNIARYIVGLAGDMKAAVEAYADMNGDGKVDNIDIVTVARIVVGL